MKRVRVAVCWVWDCCCEAGSILLRQEQKIVLNVEQIKRNGDRVKGKGQERGLARDWQKVGKLERSKGSFALVGGRRQPKRRSRCLPNGSTPLSK
jgi:hypothetical protein